MDKPVAAIERMRDTERRRFWHKVKVGGPDDCWIWLGGSGSNGYGLFFTGKKSEGAHRAAYRFAKGPISDGMHICHKCDIKACVNPNHLFVGTTEDNMQDAVAKGRVSRGANRPLSKMTDDLVRKMRLDRAAGLSYPKLARKYGVCQDTANMICRRLAWTHVE